MKTFATCVLLGTFFAACASAPSHHRVAPRIVIATYDVWDGSVRRGNDPRVRAARMRRSADDYRTSTAPLHRSRREDARFRSTRRRANAGYREISEIQVTGRPEVLIFKGGTKPARAPSDRLDRRKGFSAGRRDAAKRIRDSKTIGSGAHRGSGRPLLAVLDRGPVRPRPPFGELARLEPPRRATSASFLKNCASTPQGHGRAARHRHWSWPHDEFEQFSLLAR